VVPGPAADVVISSSNLAVPVAPALAPTATVLGADMAIKTLTISDTNGLGLNGDGYTLTITPASSAGGITMSAGVPASAIGANVKLGASQTWTNNSVNALTVSGVISEASAATSLTKEGAGALILSGASTHTGATTINAGTLNLANRYAAQSSTLTMGGGTAALVFDSSVAGNAFTLGGLAASTAGAGYDIALRNNAGTPAAIALTVGGNNASTYAGVLSGDGSLAKAGIGTLGLSGNNTYTGGTTLTAGQLNINAQGADITNSAIGTGMLTINGGTIDAANGAIDLSGTTNNAVTIGGSFAFGGSNALNLGTGAADITASRTITLNGNNPLTFGPATNTANAATTLTVNNGAGTGGGTALILGSYALTGGTNTAVRTTTITGTGNVTITGAVTNGQAYDNNLTKSGAGTLTLCGSNTYTGATTLSGGGTLKLNYDTTAGGTNSSKLDDGKALTLSGGTLALSGGSHEEIVSATTINTAGTFLTRDGGTSKLRMNIIARAVGGTISFADATIAKTDTTGSNGILGGYATLGDDWAINSTGAEDGPITALASYTGALPQTGGVNTDNDTLTGGQTQSGAVAANTVKIANSGNGDTLDLGTNNLTITSTSATSLGGILYVGGGDNNYTISGSTGRIVSSTANQELIFTVNTGTLTVSAFVAASSGSSPVTKTGAGTLAISSANAFTGTTRVNQGVLQLRSNTAAGTTGGGIVVQNGAALELANSVAIGAEALTLVGNGISNGGALRNIAGNTSSYAGAITMGDGGARINSDIGGALTLTGNIVTAAGKNVTIGGAGNVTAQTGAISGAGNLTKDGAGNVTLSGNSTYTGATTVSAGTLVLSGAGHVNATNGITVNGATAAFMQNSSVANSRTFTLTQGTLGGTGTINTAITSGPDVIIAPGDRTLATAAPGTLTIANAVNLSGTTEMRLFSVTESDKLSQSTTGSLTYGGILKIIDLDPVAFAIGNSWDLFDFESQSGTFSNDSDFGTVGGINLPLLTADKKWSFDYTQGILSVALGVILGDTNSDNVVDAADFITLKKNFNKPGAGEAQGNFNSDVDGFVDWADLSILMSAMSPGGSGAPPVPEPATLGLLAIGALAVIRRRRRA